MLTSRYIICYTVSDDTFITIRTLVDRKLNQNSGKFLSICDDEGIFSHASYPPNLSYSEEGRKNKFKKTINNYKCETLM